MTASRTILLTGADGCVGTAIADYLRGQGDRVIGVVFARPAVHPDEIRLDITSDALGPLDEVLGSDRLSAIIHAAGIVDPHVPRARVFAVNAEGTERIAGWAARRVCPHFVQISSVSVYGPRAMGRARIETTPRARYFGLAYSRSKALAEEHVERSGLSYSLLRLPMVIGRGDVFVTPTLAAALRDGSFFLAGRGDGVVSVMTVRNLGPMIEALLEAGPANGALNFACHTISWRELVRAYADVLGVPFRPRPAPPPTPLLRGRTSEYMLLYGMSRFGGEFPTARLEAHLARAGASYERVPWREAVADAVRDLGA